jgi:thiol-disulfide isomerase/thioredoxin
MTNRKRPTRPTTAASARRFPVWPVLIGALVVAGVLAVVLTSGGGDDDSADARETAPVTISGETLPQAPRQADEPDPAIGDVAPTLTGSNFAGDEVTIAADDGEGTAKAIFFVAHWCPHCQDEVPRLAAWLESHDLPAGLDLEIVSTQVGASNVNSPPSAWLEREGLGDITTMMDDDQSSAYAAYGAGGLPYVVYLNADNEVVLRTQGEYGDDPEIFTQLFEDVAAGQPVEDPRF